MSVGLPSDEVAEDYKSSLEDLVDNSRLVINNLTVIANENIEHASAISRILENHIKSAPPNRKLPALYLLDSIVKNVGTPYTLFLSRNLYSTFMNAYSLVNTTIRQKLDEMLHTWKLPNPGSLETKPVFPIETTGPIEHALQKARSAAFEQQQHQARRAQQEAMARGRQMPQANIGYRHTPTPPQLNGQFRSPAAQNYVPQGYQQQSISNSQYQQPTPHYVQPTQYSLPTPALPVAQQSYQPVKPYQAPAPPVDLPLLHRDIEELIRTTQGESAVRPYDSSVRGRLDALMALQALLQNQYHPPDQLQQVRNQVTQLKTNSSSNAMFPAQVEPSHSPSLPHHPPQYQPSPSQPILSQQTPVQTSTPQPTDLQAFMSSRNLADIIANAQKGSQTPPMSQTSLLQTNTTVQAPIASGGGASDLLASLKKAGMLNASSTPPMPPQQYAQPPTLSSSPSNLDRVNDSQLNSASLKIPRTHLISFLYESQPNQCTTCGRRFLATEDGREKKRRHYDYHFRTNQRINDTAKRAQNRSWYVDELEWIKSRDDPESNNTDIAATLHALDEGAAVSDPKRRFVTVPADQVLANQPCPICQEKFIASYNDEVSDWVWMDAVQIGARIYHASCHSEIKKTSSRESTPVRIETPDSVLGKRKAVDRISPASKKLVKA